MNILDYLKDNILCLDGGMGTLLQQSGLSLGELPETWNITHPDVIREIHRAYFDAGCNVVNTNTFGANLLKMSPSVLEATVSAAIANAKRAAEESTSDGEKWVALDIGPSGRMLKPYGDFDFEDAVAMFAETVKLGVKYGADLIFIETMNDSYETKAAVLAAKENSSLPIFVSNAYGEDGKLMTGASVGAMVALLEGMGVDAIGMNCSLGPKALESVAREYLEYSSLPIIFKPNAGIPSSVGGKTVYDVSSEDFAETVYELVKLGVRAVGGCCGTTPEYISALARRIKDIKPSPIVKKQRTVVSSYTHEVVFGDSPVLIGERINPTGKKRFKEALRERDIDYILKEGISEQERGAHVLDVNVGLPEIDETEMLTRTVCELQAIIDLPLQIDTSDISAMESALRRYNGKAMINSVNGKAESMKAVFPLAKKYGGLIVALTLDEGGIPATADARLDIARKILREAEEFGIEKKDIIFDPLAMTVSSDPNAARETLRALRLIREELGCHTSLGVSNVSFGLPERDVVNGIFFTLALGAGLSAAIMNPHSEEMMKAYYAFRALVGVDANCSDYIAYSENMPKKETVGRMPTATDAPTDFSSALELAIVKGLKEQAVAAVCDMLGGGAEPLAIVEEGIIPALNRVGEGFEKKTVYLPQLLMSAEAASAAFEVIKEKAEKKTGGRCKIVLATVKGDIHDIGKNIVKLLLENFGYEVIDLGKDVPPEKILDETLHHRAPIVGLSALMTTTVPSMEDTVRMLKEKAPFCKVMVGGAVLTPEYAERIGADGYAKDAMEAVRVAEKLFK